MYDEPFGPGLEELTVLAAVGEDLLKKGEPSLKKQENFIYTTDLQIIQQISELYNISPNYTTDLRILQQISELYNISPNYTTYLQIIHHSSKLNIIAPNYTS